MQFINNIFMFSVFFCCEGIILPCVHKIDTISWEILLVLCIFLVIEWNEEGKSILNFYFMSMLNKKREHNKTRHCLCTVMNQICGSVNFPLHLQFHFMFPYVICQNIIIYFFYFSLFIKHNWHSMCDIFWIHLFLLFHHIYTWGHKIMMTDFIYSHSVTFFMN